MSTQVTNPSLATDAVATTNIQNLAVTAGKLAAVLDLSGKTLTLPALSTPVFTRSFESAQQTITAGGLLTIDHFMDQPPKLILTSLICQTGEFNWIAGDEVQAIITAMDGTRQSAIFWDDTSVYVRMSLDASLCTVANKVTAGVSAITNANWKLVVRAFA